MKNAIYKVLVPYMPLHQANDQDRPLYEKISANVDGINCILLVDLDSPNERETRQAPAEAISLLEFAKKNKKFLMQWVRELTKRENILNLVLSTEIISLRT